MKKIISPIFIFVFCFLNSCFFYKNAFAQQLTKAEKKALQKEIKDFQKNPQKYKDFKESLQNKKETVEKDQKELSKLEESIEEIKKEIKEKDTRIDQLGNELMRLQEEAKQTAKVEKKEANTEGVVYKVQIVIPENALYEDKSPDGGKRVYFNGEQDADGVKKYTFGFFGEQAEAEKFKNYLQMLRIKDVIVTKYKNGVKEK